MHLEPVGGPLIGTTLWSGPSFRDVLATAKPQPGANYAHMLSQDGFDEVVALSTVQSDPRVILAYDWNGQPLPTAHGFPLRVYIPDLYGMKQPKWITDIVLVPDFIPGYWVSRGWDKQAIRRTTSVIDTVATSDLQKRAGRTYVPVGGIADAGARGISKVRDPGGRRAVGAGRTAPAALAAHLGHLAVRVAVAGGRTHLRRARLRRRRRAADDDGPSYVSLRRDGHRHHAGQHPAAVTASAFPPPL